MAEWHRKNVYIMARGTNKFLAEIFFIWEDTCSQESDKGFYARK